MDRIECGWRGQLGRLGTTSKKFTYLAPGSTGNCNNSNHDGRSKIRDGSQVDDEENVFAFTSGLAAARAVYLFPRHRTRAGYDLSALQYTDIGDSTVAAWVV